MKRQAATQRLCPSLLHPRARQADPPNGALPASANGGNGDGGGGGAPPGPAAPPGGTQGAKLRRALSRTTLAPEGFPTEPGPGGAAAAGGGGGGRDVLSGVFATSAAGGSKAGVAPEAGSLASGLGASSAEPGVGRCDGLVPAAGKSADPAARPGAANGPGTPPPPPPPTARGARERSVVAALPLPAGWCAWPLAVPWPAVCCNPCCLPAVQQPAPLPARWAGASLRHNALRAEARVCYRPACWRLRCAVAHSQARMHAFMAPCPWAGRSRGLHCSPPLTSGKSVRVARCVQLRRARARAGRRRSRRTRGLCSRARARRRSRRRAGRRRGGRRCPTGPRPPPQQRTRAARTCP